MTLGTRSQPQGKLLDYEQFIDHQLNRTRTRIKFIDIMTACLILLAGFLGVLFLEVVLDHAVGLPLLLRRLVLAAGLSAAATFSAFKIVMPLLRRVNGIYAARTIEDADPDFKNSLINYLELRRHRASMSKAIMATLESRAVTDLTHVEVDNVVNQHRMLKAVYAISGLLRDLFAVRHFLAQEHLRLDAPGVSGRRLPPDQHPARQHQARQRPRSFGSRRRRARDVFRARRGGPAEEGFAPLQRRRRPVLRSERVYPGGQMYDPWQVTLTNVQQSMDYYLTGGDAESSRYHLEVLAAPTITSISVDLYIPPIHGRARPQRTSKGETSRPSRERNVTVHARTNMPASLATLDDRQRRSAPDGRRRRMIRRS